MIFQETVNAIFPILHKPIQRDLSNWFQIFPLVNSEHTSPNSQASALLCHISYLLEVMPYRFPTKKQKVVVYRVAVCYLCVSRVWLKSFTHLLWPKADRLQGCPGPSKRDLDPGQDRKKSPPSFSSAPFLPLFPHPSAFSPPCISLVQCECETN